MGDRSDINRQELQSALAAVTTTFAAGRPVSPAPDASSPALPAAAGGKAELATAYDKLVEHEAAKPATYIPPPPPKWKRYVRPVIIVLSVGIAGYLTTARPAWLYPTFDPPAPPRTEAAAERMLVATSLLVQQYQQEYGHLPANMSDIEGSFPSVSLMDTGAGSYQLFGGAGGRSLVMTVTPGQQATLQGGTR